MWFRLYVPSVQHGCNSLYTGTSENKLQLCAAASTCLTYVYTYKTLLLGSCRSRIILGIGECSYKYIFLVLTLNGCLQLLLADSMDHINMKHDMEVLVF